MKRKLVAMILGTMLCATCLVACGPVDSDRQSPIIVDEETEQTTEDEEKTEYEDEDKDETDESVSENEVTDETETDTDAKDSDEDSVEKETTDDDSDVDDSSTVDADKDSAESEDDTEDTEEKEVKDPYAGLAVAKCHSVTLPMGTSYNDAIAEVIKGTSAYPDTYPNIYGVDLNTPGIYTCYWEQKQADGTYLPLNYAVFTVTIYDPNPAPTPETPQ